MKLLFASDIHGSITYCRQLYTQIERESPDKIVLLGDLLYHGPRNDLPDGYAPKEVIPLLNSLRDHIIAVRGNCDAEVDQMVLGFPCMADYTTIMTESGKIIFVTHGHLVTPEEHSQSSSFDAFISGHTHIKQAYSTGHYLVVNPGSISIPKDGSRSYALFSDDMFVLKDLEGAVLEETTWE